MFKAYGWSPKGKKSVIKEGDGHAANDWFIVQDGKVIAQVDETDHVVIVGWGHCLSYHPDSFHVEIEKDLTKVTFNPREHRPDYKLNPKMKAAAKILTEQVGVKIDLKIGGRLAVHSEHSNETQGISLHTLCNSQHRTTSLHLPVTGSSNTTE